MIYMVSLELVSLAFTSGALAFLNPCSFALLPAFISYFVGKEEEGQTDDELREALKGIKFGLLATLGFATVFLSVGGLVSWIGTQVRIFIPPVLLVVGIILVGLGISWSLDIHAFSLTSHGINVKLPKSSFFLFGIAYALSSLACVFPIFLMLVFSSFGTGGYFSSVLVFLSFTLGMGLLMVITSTSVAISKTFLIEKFENAKKHVTRASGIVLVIAGVYLIYYWLTTYFL